MRLQTLTINLDGETVDTDEGDNVLSVLLSHDIDVRYGCRAGACGACRLYDCDRGETILACQTSVVSALSLTTQIPSIFLPFSLVSQSLLSNKTSLDDVSSNSSSIALSLLGPSDDSFGDRVIVRFADADEESSSYECMAVNEPGELLTIVAQQAMLSDDAWQKVIALPTHGSIQVSSVQGVRKGRLLYELDLEGSCVVVVSSAANGVFERYWQQALLTMSAQFLGHFTLSNESAKNNNESVSLSSSELHYFLQIAQSNSGGAVLHVIYHGQNLPVQAWEQMLRPLRIRTNQLHFIR